MHCLVRLDKVKDAFATALGVWKRARTNEMFVAVAPRRVAAHHLPISACGVLAPTEAASRTLLVSLPSGVHLATTKYQLAKQACVARLARNGRPFVLGAGPRGAAPHGPLRCLLIATHTHTHVPDIGSRKQWRLPHAD